MESAKGKIILIPGGTGVIGQGIVKVLIDQGATIIVPSVKIEFANYGMGCRIKINFSRR